MADEKRKYERGEGSIFKAFWDAKDTINRNLDVFKEPEYMALIVELEKYFKSYKWAKNTVERQCFFYSDSGLNGDEIAERIGIKINNYRNKVYTISHRLCDSLFNGAGLSSVCIGDNVEAVRNALKRVNYLNTAISFRLEFPENIGTAIENRIKDETPSEYTTGDVFNALAYLMFNSTRIQNARLERINPSALKYVVERLQETEYNEIFGYYKALGNYAFRAEDVPKSVIESIMASCK